MSNQSLFRTAAVQQKTGKLEGDVIIAQPLGASMLTVVMLLLVALLMTFLARASFHRKETVQGYVVPTAGLARVTAPRSGVIQKRFVNDGEQVEAGDPIVLLHIPEQLADGSNLAAGLAHEFAAQQALLQQRVEQLQQHTAQQLAETERRLTLSRNTLSELTQQYHIVRQRLQLHDQRYFTFRKLHQEGAIAEVELQQQYESLLDLQQQQAVIRANQQQQQALIEQLQGTLTRLPTEEAQNLANLAVERSRLQQQQVELNARGHVLITAPVSGRITNFVADNGHAVVATRPLLTIIPEHTELQAVLLVPTRAFGFIAPGQPTRIRFDAFPYQRFGLYEGEVVRTGQAIVMPGEVDMPVAIQEPMYRVEVALGQQNIRAYGNNIPLQSGMLLSADIVLEQRSLISWLFEPILSLRGRM